MPEGRISQSLPGPLGRWLPATPEIALSALALTAWVAPEAFGHALIRGTPVRPSGNRHGRPAG